LPPTNSRIPRSGSNTGKAPVIPLSRQDAEYIAAALDAEKPPGCEKETYERIAAAMSATKGTSVFSKCLEYWKSLEGSTKEGADHILPSILGHIGFADSRRNVITHFGFIEKLFSDAFATSNYKLLNVSSPAFQENLQAVLLLKFNHPKFALSAFHPNMTALSTPASIKKMLGECEQMDWQKKSYSVLTDQQDIANCADLKRILHHLWVPLSTIGLIGIGAVMREFIDGLDRWGERGCSTSQVTEALAQLEHDLGIARTQAMGHRHDTDNASSRLPAFEKSTELKSMIANLNDTTRAKQQQAYAMQAKAASLYGNNAGPNQAATGPAQGPDTAELMKLMQNLKKNLTPSNKTPKAPSISPNTGTLATKTVAPTTEEIMKFSKNLKWQTTIGTRTIKGKVEKMCWFRCNHPTGCSQGTKCKSSHACYPTAYKNGPFAKLPIATRWSILQSCRKQ
jgi:hypothetical protein